MGAPAEVLAAARSAEVTPPGSRRAAHVPALDAVRGVAILMVMGYHFNQGPEDSSAVGRALAKVLSRGELGVDLYFVLSGFLITGILADAKESPRYFRTFYIRRTLRIFPLYYGVLLTCFVLLPLVGFTPYRDTGRAQGWLWLYGTNLIQAWKGQWFLTGFNHFWSLAVEEHFYLVWPLVIFWCSRRAALIVCGVCVGVAVATRVAFAFAGNEVAAYALTPCRMDALAVGAFLALALRGPGGLPVVRPWAVRGAVLCLLLLVGTLVWNAQRLPGAELALALRGTLYAGLFGAGLILSVAAAPGRLWGRFGNSRPLQFFGKYSYGLYVFHHPFLPLFESLFAADALAAALGSPLAGKLLYMLAATAASVVLALLSWHLYEKHFLRLKDAWAGK